MARRGTRGDRGDGRARSRSRDRRSRCGVTDQDAEEEIDGRPRSRSDGRSRCSGDGGAEEEMEVGARCSRSDGRSRATQMMASEVPGDAVLEVGEDLLRVHHTRLLRRLPAESGTSATLGRPEEGCWSHDRAPTLLRRHSGVRRQGPSLKVVKRGRRGAAVQQGRRRCPNQLRL
jgi:hypothetical protein